MNWDFNKKKKVSNEELANEEEGKAYEDDAQTYFKSLRAKREKEQMQKDTNKKIISKEERKKRKEREAYYKEVRKIYSDKEKKI